MDTPSNALNVLLKTGDDILAFMLRPDVLGAMLAAVIGAVIGIGGLMWVERGKARKEDELRKRNQLGKYVAELADHLGGMVQAFKSRKIPHTDGRAFVGLMHGFRDMFDASLSPDIKHRLGALEGLAHNAGKLDTILYCLDDLSDLKEEKHQDFENWILTAERLQGDLYAEAQRLNMMHKS